MTTTAYAPQNLLPKLSKKQQSFMQKYKDVPKDDLTDNVRASWTVPVPLPLGTTSALQRVMHKTVLLVLALIFAFLGTQMVAAVYYLVFETTGTMNNFWHSLVSDGNLRHAIRDVGEGLIGGLFGQHIIRNRYKPLKPLRWLDKLEIRLHIANIKDDKPLSGWQLLATPFLVLLYACPGFFIALGVIQLIQHNGTVHGHITSFFSWLHPILESHLGQAGQNYAQKVQDSLVDAWPNKLSGFAAAFFFGRRPFKGVSDDVQLWLIQQRYMRYEINVGKYPWYTRLLPFLRGPVRKMNVSRKAPLLYGPTWRATYNDVFGKGGASGVKYRQFLAVVLIPLLVVAGLFLMGYGVYVTTIIANRPAS